MPAEPKEPRQEERFWAKVAKAGPIECWLWTAARNLRGYGSFYFDGHNINAHRAAYIMLVGPVADGLQVDHLCRVRACVNPAHLEPVTQTENQRRGQGLAGQNHRKTHCIAGHPYAGSNLRVRNGKRYCHICRIVNQRLCRARKAATA